MPPQTAPKDAPDEPATIDVRALRLLPTPGRRKAQLNSLEGVRGEMARVYRDAESGKRDTAEASKLVFMLGQIGQGAGANRDRAPADGAGGDHLVHLC